MKKYGKLFVFFIPTFLALYQIFLILIYDVPAFVNGENSEIILYDSIGTRLYSNAQATMRLSFGYSRIQGKEISIRSQTLARYLKMDRVHLEKLVVTEGVRWTTYFHKNGSPTTFDTNTQDEIRRQLYNECWLFLVLGSIPPIAVFVMLQIAKFFIQMKNKFREKNIQGK